MPKDFILYFLELGMITIIFTSGSAYSFVFEDIVSEHHYGLYYKTSGNKTRQSFGGVHDNIVNIRRIFD